MGHLPAKEYERFRLSTFPLATLKKNGWREKYRLPSKGDRVRIGSDVWIGCRAIILPSVAVGDGAIIGAGAVVTHDVPPYAVVAGVPAKIVRFRFDKVQIEKLLKIAWWNWSERKIVENLDYFYGDVNEFIRRFSQ
jgi:tetrahydrodipicolinate N-succinyltransferase